MKKSKKDSVQKVGDVMKINRIDPFPPNCNPFNHDLYHMGTQVGNNAVVMHANHSDKRCAYIIVINIETGERVKIEFTAEAGKEQKKAKMVDRVLKYGCLSGDDN